MVHSLIVDDAAELRTLVSDYLKHYGMRVTAGRALQAPVHPDVGGAGAEPSVCRFVVHCALPDMPAGGLPVLSSLPPGSFIPEDRIRGPCRGGPPPGGGPLAVGISV